MLSNPAEPAAALLKVRDGLVQHLRGEVRPQHIGEPELGIGRLPGQEVGQTELAAGPDEQVRVRNARRVQVAGQDFFRQILRIDLTSRTVRLPGLDRPDDLVPATVVEANVDLTLLKDTINDFLRQLDKETRIIFVQRYYYMATVKEIAANLHLSDSKVKMTLLRTREKLRVWLQEEGYEI